MNIEEYVETIAQEVLLEDSPEIAQAKIHLEMAELNACLDNLNRVKSILKIKASIVKHLGKFGRIEV